MRFLQAGHLAITTPGAAALPGMARAGGASLFIYFFSNCVNFAEKFGGILQKKKTTRH
jgi:hypothetical protein